MKRNSPDSFFDDYNDTSSLYSDRSEKIYSTYRDIDSLYAQAENYVNRRKKRSRKRDYDDDYNF